jgi:hypothetical protein
MKTYALALATSAAIAALSVQPSAAQTDIVRKPSEWRGTLLEGTDALIATDRHGYALFIQTDQTVGAVFEPAPFTGEQLAAEFKALCLDTQFDETKLASAAGSSGLGLTLRSIEVPPAKAGPSYRGSVWVSPAGRVQIWSGDTSGLSRRQTLSRWRNGATASVLGSSDVRTPSCGLTVMSTGFHSPEAFVAAMTRLLAAEPAKAVTKVPWADGHWTIAGPGGETRITYSMTDLNREEQLLHVAVTDTTRRR